MKANSSTRSRRDILRLVHGGPDLPALFREAGRLLRRVIPFDAACWHTLDPATLLETSHLVENLPLENPRAAEIEYLYEDYNQFATLARSRQRSGILSQATGGAPERSRRYRELIRPLGLHGELRGAFVAGRVGWGAVGLLREPGAADFSSRDAAFLHDVSAYLAHGIRTALLLQTAAGGTQGEDVPGLVLFDARQRLEAITPAAEGLLAELADDAPAGARPSPLPYVVHAVASRAALVGRSAGAEAMARARVRTKAGRWLLLHGAVIERAASPRIAVIVEVPQPPTLAPLLIQAYGLTERERELMRRMLQGLSTKEIAEALGISSYTVQEHFQAIFDKVGVRSRRELVGQVFQHYQGHAQHG